MGRRRGGPEPEVPRRPRLVRRRQKDNFTGYKLLIADVIGGTLKAVPRGVMAAGAIMDGARGGIDVPHSDVDRVKSHLAKYYRKMDESPPWER